MSTLISLILVYGVCTIAVYFNLMLSYNVALHYASDRHVTEYKPKGFTEI
jgi:hypothetical protein